jgi:hypothetical protein
MLDIHYGQVCKQKSFSRQALMKERTRHWHLSNSTKAGRNMSSFH